MWAVENPVALELNSFCPFLSGLCVLDGDRTYEGSGGLPIPGTARR